MYAVNECNCYNTEKFCLKAKHKEYINIALIRLFLMFLINRLAKIKKVFLDPKCKIDCYQCKSVTITLLSTVLKEKVFINLEKNLLLFVRHKSGCKKFDKSKVLH